MKRRSVKGILSLATVILTILACNVPSGATEVPATESPATELVTVVDTASPPPATELPIQHQVYPVNLPQDQSGRALDNNSSKTAKQNKANGGDRFTFEKFERPFNSNSMDSYFPEIDIIDTSVFQDNDWIYGAIQVVDRSAATVSPYYFAMQLDTDLNGKGDYLVRASSPPSADWTTEGAQIFLDANHDVGNLSPSFSDENAANGDGFETLIFDQGNGDDPDAAWARVSPQDPNTVEIAVKRSALNNASAYLVNMWAGHDMLNPSLFDFSDHFTHEQAGAADPAFPNFYPLKELYEIDNTCRMAVGFPATGNEPGLCTTVKPVVPVGEDPPPPGCQLNDAICAQMGPGYYFDAASCQCFYLGFNESPLRAVTNTKSLCSMIGQ